MRRAPRPVTRSERVEARESARKSRIVGVLVVLCGASVLARAQCPELQKLIASDPASADVFGRSVSTSAGASVLGAPGDDGPGTNAGAAYVFRYDPALGHGVEEQKLEAPNEASQDLFGHSVSMSGDVIVVGAPLRDDSGTDAGTAYVFRYDPSTLLWNLEQQLDPTPDASGDEFGRAVSLSGNVLVVGAPFDDDVGVSNAGAAYVYRYQKFVGWILEQKLVASVRDVGDEFGHSVGTDGEVVVVGAWKDDAAATDSGTASVFRFDGGSSTWNEEAQLSGSSGAAGDEFGVSVAVHGDAIVVGIHGADLLGGESGAAELFEYDASSRLWLLTQLLLAPNGAAGDEFGAAVAINDSLLVIGAPDADGRTVDCGTAYFFRACRAGRVYDSWYQASDGNTGDRFGTAVDLGGSVAVVGAEADHHSGRQDAGAAYVCEARALALAIDPLDPAAGSPMTIKAYHGNENQWVLLAAVELNGTPLFRQVLLWKFGSDHTAWLHPVCPPGLSGLVVTFKAFKVSACGKGVAVSNPRTVSFQ